MRLLVVEDDVDSRELLRELLSRDGWDVSVAATVGAALEALRVGGFEVVISDEDLAGESGSAMLGEASTEGLLRHMHVLMYTGQARRLDVPEGARVLRKPFDAAELRREANTRATKAKGPDHHGRSPS